MGSNSDQLLHRKFYDLSEAYKSKEPFFTLPPVVKDSVSANVIDQSLDHGRKLSSFIDFNIIGKELDFNSPFGRRKVVYCDYTASGKSLKCIENYITEQVLPSYGNTHTTTSVTSLQTTLFRHEAREILRNTIGASEEDALIFVGSGCTGAVHKLINGLGFKDPPIVFVGASEHHSNLLPWREIASEVIRIQENSDGLLDLSQLESALKSAIGKRNTNNRQLIGCFSAASNITGTLNPDLSITALLHQYGALAFWDYAAAAPYVNISMNPSTIQFPSGVANKDALYFSVHKFVGGVQTPGILVVKKTLLRNRIPNGGGGGTVFFVDRSGHRYLRDPEMREEGGTPAIVESIRAGLVLKLKESVTSDWIMEREDSFIQMALKAWRDVPELILLGSFTAPRLAIFSFLIRHPKSGLYLHHNFVCALLNDLYGIQTRGGCACAGPYALDLLGIDEPLANRYEAILIEDDRLDRTHLRRKEEHSCYEILRPGFIRFNLPYFASDVEVDFILRAVRSVAQNGWKLLPHYQMNVETGEWHHQSQYSFKDRKWLGFVDFSTGEMRLHYPKSVHSSGEAPSNYEECLEEAEKIFEKTDGGHLLPDQRLSFNAESTELRWFLLPSEAQEFIRGSSLAPDFRQAPFTPRQYASFDAQTYNLEQYSTIFSQRKNNRSTSLIHDEEAIVSHNENRSKVDELSETENDFTAIVNLYDDDNDNDEDLERSIRVPISPPSLWMSPVRSIMKPTIEALTRHKMIRDGDRVLVCLSGGKDSLSLLHTLRQYQQQSRRFSISFEMGAVTVDPGSNSYDPSPLIPYIEQLGIPYFYERQCIIDKAMDMADVDSICSFCSRLKRGRIYATARNHGYNVIALGQHLDDLAESFFMSTFHNGRLRTMKAAYENRQRDLRIIRPFVYVREKELRNFALEANLPVIPENCPACFEAPKERHRIKQLLAQQELLYPFIYLNIKTSLLPLMSIDQPFVEKQLFGKQSYIVKREKLNKKPVENGSALMNELSAYDGVNSFSDDEDLIPDLKGSMYS